ncbi:MAG: HtrA protease/chaperone protein [Chthonomonadaceae bacterium]|nr:HtrA protease/chaperone protein [Chthonomonadaceae bacterium]
MKICLTIAFVLAAVSLYAPLSSVQAAPIMQQADANGTHAISEEAQVYQAVKSGIVTVESDFGHGSGFVVDKSGLVLTNQHVIDGTVWIALRFGRGVRVPATLLFEDKEADVAVLCFNPAAVKAFAVIPLADSHQGVLGVEGERVLAIGNPLHQDTVLTTGIISKIENGVIISNVNINHGSSGGPLLNLSGQAIGITTFGDFTEQGGPGISGVIAISKVEHALTEAHAKFAGVALPPPTILPDISPIPIPTAALSDAGQRSIKPEKLKVAGFEAVILTPFVLASERAELDRAIAKNKGKRAKPDGRVETDPARFWEQYVGTFDQATVTFRLRPQIRETSGSKRRGIFGAIIGAAVLVPITTKKSFEFSADFSEMQLYRGETLIEPLRRNRVAVTGMYDSAWVKIKDKSYGGLYQYDPAVFEPGQPIKIRVKRTSDPMKWETIAVDAKAQEHIWADFAPYRAACDTTSKALNK